MGHSLWATWLWSPGAQTAQFLLQRCDFLFAPVPPLAPRIPNLSVPGTCPATGARSLASWFRAWPRSRSAT